MHSLGSPGSVQGESRQFVQRLGHEALHSGLGFGFGFVRADGSDEADEAAVGAADRQAALRRRKTASSGRPQS
jgi:hypothetical protein